MILKSVDGSRVEGATGGFWGYNGQAEVVLAKWCKGEKHNSTVTDGECYAVVKIANNPNACWEKTTNKSAL